MKFPEDFGALGHWKTSTQNLLKFILKNAEFIELPAGWNNTVHGFPSEFISQLQNAVNFMQGVLRNESYATVKLSRSMKFIELPCPLPCQKRIVFLNIFHFNCDFAFFVYFKLLQMYYFPFA